MTATANDTKVQKMF